MCGSYRWPCFLVRMSVNYPESRPGGAERVRGSVQGPPADFPAFQRRAGQPAPQDEDVVQVWLSMYYYPRSSHKKKAVGGQYQKIIEDIQRKCDPTKDHPFNPCGSIRVLLADDNTFCNSTMRSMIERADGKFSVHSSFNGVDVYFIVSIRR